MRRFLLVGLVWIMVLVTGTIQAQNACDNITIVLENSDCQPPYSVRISGKNIPEGSSCTWKLPNNKTLPYCPGGLDTVMKSGIYEVTLVVNDGQNTCTKTHSIELKTKPKLQFSVTPQTICDPSDNISIAVLGLNSFSERWTIIPVDNPGDNRVIVNKILNIKLNSGEYDIAFQCNDEFGCLYWDTVPRITVPEPVSINFDIEPTSACVPNGVIAFPTTMTVRINTNRAVSLIEWSAPNANPPSGTGNTFTTEYGNESDNITLKVTLADGCIFEKTRSETFKYAEGVKPVLSKPSRDTICVDESVVLVNLTQNRPQDGKFIWGRATPSPTNPDTAYFIGRGDGWQKITLTFKNDNCEEKVTQEVFVINPKVEFRPVEDCDQYICQVPYTANFIIEPYDSTYIYIWVVKDELGNDVYRSIPGNAETWSYTFSELNRYFNIYLEYKTPPPFSCSGTEENDHYTANHINQYIRILKPSIQWSDTTTLTACLNKGISLTANAIPDNIIKRDYQWYIRSVADSIKGKWKILKTTEEPQANDLKPDSVGAYWVKLVVNNGPCCSDSIFRKVIFTGRQMKPTLPKNVMDFGCRGRNGYLDFPLNFEVLNDNLGADTVGISYIWERISTILPLPKGFYDEYDFLPDSTVRNPTLRIYKDGIYKIHLSSIHNGCTVINRTPLFIHVGLNAKIDAPKQLECINQKISVRANFGQIKADKVTWTVEPAPTNPNLPVPLIDNDTLFNTEIKFEEYGEYIIKLKAISNKNPNLPCDEEISDTIRVVRMQDVSFTATDYLLKCAPKKVAFNINNPNANQYIWHFVNDVTGKEEIISSQNPYTNFDFLENKSYTVFVEADFGNGCNSKSDPQKIKLELPRPDFEQKDNILLCGQKNLTFENRSYLVERIQADFGDGTTENYPGNIPQVSHTYQLPNLPPFDPKNDSTFLTFKSQFIVNIDNSCIDSVEQNKTFISYVRVYREPQTLFSITPQRQCSTTTVLAEDAGSRFTETYEWDTDNDGNYDATGKQTTITVTPKVTTTYSINYRTANAGGCYNVDQKTFTVYPLPKSDFEIITQYPCTQQPVQFRQSATGPLKIVSYLWQFGDALNSTSTDPETEFTYPDAGNYVVKLTVTDANGCTHSQNQKVTVSKPEARFTIDKPSIPNILFYPPENKINITSDLPNIAKWEWQFGGNSNYEERTPPFEYTLPPTEGDFTIRLRATNQGSCQEQYELTLRQKEEKIIFPTLMSANNDGINDKFVVDYVGDRTPTVQIYDRFGVKVADLTGSDALKAGWDGSMNGTPCAEGVYFFYFKVGSYERSGHFSLLR